MNLLPSQPMGHSADPSALADSLTPLEAGERLRLLYRQFGPRLVATTSFGLQAAVMLHLPLSP